MCFLLHLHEKLLNSGVSEDNWGCVGAFTEHLDVPVLISVPDPELLIWSSVMSASAESWQAASALLCMSEGTEHDSYQGPDS